MVHPFLYIGPTEKKGRGVFADGPIEANTLIEIAPVIVMESADRIHLDKTLLHDYIFEWGHKKEKCCVALGNISMYNHSYSSNCEYIMDYDDDNIFIKTVRAIQKGEELTINYNGDWNDEAKVWFEVGE